MTAQALLERCAADAAGRLRWRVMGMLGICPASLWGLLLTKRRALRLACQLVLDGEGAPAAEAGNPNFDEARFAALARGEDV